MYGLMNAKPSHSGGIGRAARTGLFVIGIVIGTGSVVVPAGYDRLTGLFKPKTNSSVIAADAQNIVPQAVDVRNHTQHLENIKASLGLPVSEMASVFGVTRQSIYKWLGGTATPEDDKLTRIGDLSRIADSFKEANLSHPMQLLRMKAFEGKSVLDLFKSGEPYAHFLPALIRESKAMDAAYNESGLADATSPRTDDWKATISIPFSNEA